MTTPETKPQPVYLSTLLDAVCRHLQVGPTEGVRWIDCVIRNRIADDLATAATFKPIGEVVARIVGTEAAE